MNKHPIAQGFVLQIRYLISFLNFCQAIIELYNTRDIFVPKQVFLVPNQPF